MALVPQVVDAVSIPVIAAGGIADGRGMAAAFMLGAEGIQTVTYTHLRTGFSAEYRKIVGELKKLSIQKAQDALMEIAGQMQT